MKKGIVFMLGVFFSSMLLAQVDAYKVEASKTYENRTKTVYLSLNADIDAETAKMIENALEAQSDIHKFSFYAAPNYQKCMFTADNAVHEDEIIALMNEVIYTNAEIISEPERDFRNRGFIQNLHAISFTLDMEIDSDLLQEVIIRFKESDLIIDVDYEGKSHFKVTSNQLLYPQDIENLLLEWDIKIVKEDIK